METGKPIEHPPTLGERGDPGAFAIMPQIDCKKKTLQEQLALYINGTDKLLSLDGLRNARKRYSTVNMANMRGPRALFKLSQVLKVSSTHTCLPSYRLNLTSPNSAKRDIGLRGITAISEHRLLLVLVKVSHESWFMNRTRPLYCSFAFALSAKAISQS